MQTQCVAITAESGWGNWLFKIAFIYSFAKKYHLPFQIIWSRSPHTHHTYQWLIDRIKKEKNYCQENIVFNKNDIIKSKQRPFHYIYDELKKKKEKTILINGLFQNEEYFKKYRTEILELFQEPTYITKIIENKYKKHLPLLRNSYFLHIRLGDHITLSWTYPENYYLDILKKIQQENPQANIMIFSDEPEKIASTYPQLIQELENMNHHFFYNNRFYNALIYSSLIYKRFFYFTSRVFNKITKKLPYKTKKKLDSTIFPNDEILSFYLMVRFNLGGIGGCSTFGWWAVWINNNPQKKVYLTSKY